MVSNKVHLFSVGYENYSRIVNPNPNSPNNPNPNSPNNPNPNPRRYSRIIFVSDAKAHLCLKI